MFILCSTWTKTQLLNISLIAMMLWNIKTAQQTSFFVRKLIGKVVEKSTYLLGDGRPRLWPRPGSTAGIRLTTGTGTGTPTTWLLARDHLDNCTQESSSADSSFPQPMNIICVCIATATKLTSFEFLTQISTTVFILKFVDFCQGNRLCI